jgi:hypothetical protein
VRRDNDVRELPAHHFIPAVAERPLRRRIELQDVALIVHVHDAVQGRLEDGRLSGEVQGKALGLLERFDVHLHAIHTYRQRNVWTLN